MSERDLEILGDLVRQSQWIKDEIGQHGHAKTGGYDEKLRRLKLDSSDPTSVMGFMGGYWKRFQTFNKEVRRDGDPRAVPMAIQQLAKVPNGLVDKVGLVLWRSRGDKDIYADEAADLVLQSSIGNLSLVNDVDYPGQLLIPAIEDTEMGAGIEALHQASVAPGDFDPEGTLDTAIQAAVHGMFTWQAYSARLRDMELDPTAPKPGEPSGTIVPWTE